MGSSSESRSLDMRCPNLFVVGLVVEHHTEQISKEAQVFVVQFIRINKSYAIMMSGGWGLVPRKFLT